MTAALADKAQKNHPVAKFYRYSFTVAGFAVFLIGCLLTSFNAAFWGGIFLLASNCCYALEKIKKRMAFLLFNATFFLFLMARPFVRSLQGVNWYSEFTESSVWFALTALFLGLFFLQVGAILFENMEARVDAREIPRRYSPLELQKRQAFTDALRAFSLFLFAVCMVCYLYQELDKLHFMRGRAYEDFFIYYKAKLPPLVGTLAAMMPASLCVFLASAPRKKLSFLPLLLYLLSAVPMLLIGVRNPIALCILFVFMYYFLRDTLPDREKWLGKGERLLLILLIPAMIIGLAAYNYIRQGSGVSMKLMTLFVDFFDKQGVSFKTICLGYAALPLMPQGLRLYTFGGIIEYLGYGTVGRSLFGTVDLGTGNNMVRALQGHSFAHSMSYVTRPDYLQGHGWGTSYLIEAYADFGWIGVILFSILTGILLMWLMRLFRGGWFARTFCLLSLTSVFFVPRAETMGWLNFILTPHFWAVILFCFIAASLSCKSYAPGGQKGSIYV